MVGSVVANEASASSILVFRSNLASPRDFGPASSKRRVSGSTPLEASKILADGR
jgi:hypothetical protein